ncbi:hypothetical protein D3C71_2237550 [compost metagenome]
MLVTRRWIIWRAKKGPALGWLKSVSSAIRSATAPEVLAGTVVPRKRASSMEWRLALNDMRLAAKARDSMV